MMKLAHKKLAVSVFTGFKHSITALVITIINYSKVIITIIKAKYGAI